jgi:hypothetical protein
LVSPLSWASPIDALLLLRNRVVAANDWPDTLVAPASVEGRPRRLALRPVSSCRSIRAKDFAVAEMATSPPTKASVGGFTLALADEFARSEASTLSRIEARASSW